MYKAVHSTAKSAGVYTIDTIYYILTTTGQTYCPVECR